MQNSDYSFVTDRGPIYFETLPNRCIVEPWNAFSSLVFLIPFAYFLFSLRGKYSKNWFVIYFLLPLLFLGGIGSTLYHAFRSKHWLMMLDVLPMFLLTLGVSYLFMLRLLKNLIVPILILTAVIYARALCFRHLPMQSAINAGYLLIGVVIFSLLLCTLLQLRDLQFQS